MLDPVSSTVFVHPKSERLVAESLYIAQPTEIGRAIGSIPTQVLKDRETLRMSSGSPICVSSRLSIDYECNCLGFKVPMFCFKTLDQTE